jgi:hypothetical protein
MRAGKRVFAFAVGFVIAGGGGRAGVSGAHERRACLLRGGLQQSTGVFVGCLADWAGLGVGQVAGIPSTVLWGRTAAVIVSSCTPPAVLQNAARPRSIHNKKHSLIKGLFLTTELRLTYRRRRHVDISHGRVT